MYALKTKVNDASVMNFLSSVENKRRQSDSYEVLDMMREVTGEEPKMWGPGIVGFGFYHYQYATGTEGDTMKIGFSPRKASLTLYILNSYEGEEPLLEKLGKHKRSVSCLYINKLADVEMDVLKQLIIKSWIRFE